MPALGSVPGIADQVLYYGEGIVAHHRGDQLAADEDLCKGNYAGAGAISGELGGRVMKKLGVPIVHQAVTNAVMGILDSVQGDTACD